MEGILNTNIKHIIFSGSAIPTIRQEANIFENILIQENTKTIEVTYRITEYLIYN